MSNLLKLRIIPRAQGKFSVCGAKLTSRYLLEGWWVSSHAGNNWAIFNDHIGGVQTSPGSAQVLFGMPMAPFLYHLRCSCSCTQFMVKSMAASITYHLSDANSLRSLCEPVKISQIYQRVHLGSECYFCFYHVLSRIRISKCLFLYVWHSVCCHENISQSMYMSSFEIIV